MIRDDVDRKEFSGVVVFWPGVCRSRLSSGRVVSLIRMEVVTEELGKVWDMAEESQDYASYGSKCDDLVYTMIRKGADDAEVYEKGDRGSLGTLYRRRCCGRLCTSLPGHSRRIGQIPYEVPQVAPDDNAQMTLATTRGSVWI